MHNTKISLLCYITASLLISSCTHVPYEKKDNHSRIEELKQTVTSKIVVIKTKHFDLLSLQEASGEKNLARVYIEGDGRSWINKRRPSDNPTPRKRLVIKLMELDPYPERFYFARPCQFITDTRCNTSVWTSNRYSVTALETFDHALSQIKSQYGYNGFELIGFSGGATLALLLAANREDIVSIRTIAGNLSPEYLNKHHNVHPMPSSLNPVNYTKTLTVIPQMHFIGKKDNIVPYDIYEYYKSTFINKNCLSHIIINNASHNKGWKKPWLHLLKQPVICKK